MRRLLRLRMLVTATVLVAVVYAGVSWVFSDKLIAPQFKPLGAVDVAKFGLPQSASVKIPGDGVTLAGWYFANPRKQRCAVIMLHGFGGGRAEVLAPTPIFWDRGCDLLLYDSRGHGESSPSLLSYGVHERQDLRLAIGWLSGRAKLPDSRIGLIGWSYGAAVSIQAAALVHDLAFVIADSSYSSLGDIASVQADNQFGWWARVFVPGALLIAGERGGFDASAAAPAALIRSVRSPVFLIHSQQDGFTPADQSRVIYAHSDHSRTQLLIPAWEATHAHSYTQNPLAYTAAVDAFLTRFAPGFGVRRKR